MKKYMTIFANEIKNSLAYRADTWLKALFNILSILLAYLLWKAVFAGQQTFQGFTLPQMTTYYLLTNVLSPLTQSEGLLSTYAAEIKGGSYAKYLVRPVSGLGYFMAAGFGRAVFPLCTAGLVFGVIGLAGKSFFAPISLISLLQAIPVILLGASLSMLMSYFIAMATFRFTDVSFAYIIQHITVLFLSGSLIPLNMIFSERIAMWLPFSYTIYYPVMLCMGQTTTPPPIGILTLWVCIFLGIALLVQKRAPKVFEGVGL